MPTGGHCLPREPTSRISLPRPPPGPPGLASSHSPCLDPPRPTSLRLEEGPVPPHYPGPCPCLCLCPATVTAPATAPAPALAFAPLTAPLTAPLSAPLTDPLTDLLTDPLTAPAPAPVFAQLTASVTAPLAPLYSHECFDPIRARSIVVIPVLEAPPSCCAELRVSQGGGAFLACSAGPLALVRAHAVPGEAGRGVVKSGLILHPRSLLCV